MISLLGCILGGIAVGLHTGRVFDAIAVACAIYALMPYKYDVGGRR